MDKRKPSQTILDYNIPSTPKVKKLPLAKSSMNTDNTIMDTFYIKDNVGAFLFDFNLKSFYVKVDEKNIISDIGQNIVIAINEQKYIIKEILDDDRKIGKLPKQEKTKDLIFFATGKIINCNSKCRLFKSVITIKIESILINELFLEEPKTIDLVKDKIITTEVNILKNAEEIKKTREEREKNIKSNKIKKYIFSKKDNDDLYLKKEVIKYMTYNIVNNYSNICKNCEINLYREYNRNLGYKLSELLTNVLNKSSGGSAKHKKTNKPTKSKICGKKTKSGKPCKVVGKCRFH